MWKHCVIFIPSVRIFLIQNCFFFFFLFLFFIYNFNNFIRSTHILGQSHILFLRYYVHIFVDLVKRSVHTHVGEISRYRNDRYNDDDDDDYHSFILYHYYYYVVVIRFKFPLFFSLSFFFFFSGGGGGGGGLSSCFLDEDSYNFFLFPFALHLEACTRTQLQRPYTDLWREKKSFFLSSFLFKNSFA